MLNASIQTARLLIRPFTLDDVGATFSWFGDAEVMRFTPNGPDASYDVTRTRIDAYMRHQLLRGFSKWVLCDRHTGRPIGDSGLMVLDDTGEVELGYRLSRPFWGIGLATEAAKAWASYSFDRLSLTRVTAFVHPENLASQRVLAKVGFSPTGRRVVMGMEAETFHIMVASTAFG